MSLTMVNIIKIKTKKTWVSLILCQNYRDSLSQEQYYYCKKERWKITNYVNIIYFQISGLLINNYSKKITKNY